MADLGRLDELKRKFEENPKRYFAPLANEYRKAGEAEIAIELCRTYLPQQPGHMSGYIVYGQALHDLGQAEESTAVFKQALTLDPENIIALRQLGDIARDSGDSAGAMRWYGKVLELDPRNEEVAAYITSIASPGSQPTSATERVAPPTVRPEPAPDASAVRLEDIVSAPDTAQLRIMADEPAQHAYEAPSEAVEELSHEPFEVTEWPSAAEVAEAEGASTQNADVLEGPWHTGSEAETRIEAAHEMGTVDFHDEAAESSTPLRLSDYINHEDAAFAPTAEELGYATPESDSEAASETAATPAPEPAPVHAVEESSSASIMEDSPFATATMAELYLQQGLRGEALTIYRQLALKRDDPTIHARIAELEADGSPHKARETVRGFFARIGQRRPNERVELAAERAESANPAANPEANIAGKRDSASPLANLFTSSEPDAGDVAAAQRLAAAFGKPQLGNSQS
jgi:tetratricopeptide (TPR) repeat protein